MFSRVCSRALARSSPVWEAMLYEPFREGRAQQKGDDWNVELPGNHPDAIRIVLQVNLDKIDEIDESTLRDDHSLEVWFHTVAAANKYNMLAKMRGVWYRWRGFRPQYDEKDPEQLLQTVSLCLIWE